MNEKNSETELCPLCKGHYTVFTEDGRHNFCPISTSNGKLINVCIKCKVKEIVALWQKDKA